MVFRRMSFLMLGSTTIPTDCNRSQSNAPVNEWLTMLPAAKYVTFSLLTGNFFKVPTLKTFGVWTCPNTRKTGGDGGRTEDDWASAGTPVIPSSNSAARKPRIVISNLYAYGGAANVRCLRAPR